jgi:hypothetical protein
MKKAFTGSSVHANPLVSRRDFSRDDEAARGFALKLFVHLHILTVWNGYDINILISIFY